MYCMCKFNSVLKEKNSVIFSNKKFQRAVTRILTRENIIEFLKCEKLNHCTSLGKAMNSY